ncbi:CDP-archaeol synthase [Inquilinus limosus]|uniref:CDP-archaeol synthase n=1 Tax=Inquilinus limosus TaxID=171674 RepID=UPI000406A1C7|nr:CDP-archaeol synthase [Inquilinus limosus]
MEIWLILRALALLAAANGAPVIAKSLFGRRCAWPLDFGTRFIDGRPLLGPSKTIRGVLLGTLAASVLAGPFGLDWTTGALVGMTAMAGDLLSSFVKRRLGLRSSGEAPGLDQVPESLIPLVVCRPLLGLDLAQTLLATGLFWMGELVVSRLLYRLGLRDRPY